MSFPIGSTKNNYSFPLIRIMLIILFTVYALIPNKTDGKLYINQLAYGHLAGALFLALPAFIIFFPIMLFGSGLLTKHNHDDSNPNIDLQNQAIQKLFHFAFYICVLGSILLLIYYILKNQKSEQYLWLTSTVAIIEIVQFIFRGSSQDKARFYLRHLLSSVVLYGAVIFISLNGVNSLSYTPLENYYLPVAIAHLCIDLILETYVLKESFKKNY